MNAFPYRYAQYRIWSILLLLLLVFSLLGGMIWRNLDRFETLRAYVFYAHRIQQVAMDIQGTLTDYFLPQNREHQGQRLAKLSEEIIDLARNDRHVASETPKNLAELRKTILTLTDEGSSPEIQEMLLVKALNITGTMVDAEMMRREGLIEEIGESTRNEVLLVFATVFVLLSLVVFFLRYRILLPLNGLKTLLLRLTDEDYTPIESKRIDPLLLPVFNSYNELVRHLAELEESNRHYAEKLESEVRTATRALMEQQAGIARNERLAAVGELAAGIAHELRNPLAGIQMSIVNLREEIDEPEQLERISLIINELKRMARLLNEILDMSKHTPAESAQFDLIKMIRELLALTRYQIPPTISLRLAGPDSLVCRLPENRIRQSLLNLILNSTQAMGQKSGTILVEVGQGPDGILLSVIDEGPGFSADLLASGVRPFVTGKSGGTGLGLAMVQRFVREMGGRLTLSNHLQKGASVHLSIPDGSF